MNQQQQVVVQKTNLEISQEVSEYLQRLSIKVDREFLEVLKNKYSESTIEKMSDAELLGKTAECLLNIHVITGWNLPDDKDYIKVLTEQFLLKLKEDFFMLNFTEIKYAFRKAVGKKDWGKNMNLELVCSVLGDYSIERSKVSFEEEKINNNPIQIIYTDEEIKNQRREEIERSFQAMKKGNYPILHRYFWEVLYEDGLLIENSEPEWEGETQVENISEFFVRKLNSNAENIYVRSE